VSNYYVARIEQFFSYIMAWTSRMLMMLMMMMIWWYLLWTRPTWWVWFS